MKDQHARICINAQALQGSLITIQGARGEPVPLHAGHDAVHNLKPGDRITIEVKSDDRWVEAQSKRLEDLDKAAAAKIDGNPKGGPNLTGKTGMTLAEGLQAAASESPQVESSPGAETADTGAQVERSTAATPAPATTPTPRATRTTRR